MQYLTLCASALLVSTQIQPAVSSPKPRQSTTGERIDYTGVFSRKIYSLDNLESKRVTLVEDEVLAEIPELEGETNFSDNQIKNRIIMGRCLIAAKQEEVLSFIQQIIKTREDHFKEKGKSLEAEIREFGGTSHRKAQKKVTSAHDRAYETEKYNVTAWRKKAIPTKTVTPRVHPSLDLDDKIDSEVSAAFKGGLSERIQAMTDARLSREELEYKKVIMVTDGALQENRELWNAELEYLLNKRSILSSVHEAIENLLLDSRSTGFTEGHRDKFKQLIKLKNKVVRNIESGLGAREHRDAIRAQKARFMGNDDFAHHDKELKKKLWGLARDLIATEREGLKTSPKRHCAYLYGPPAGAYRRSLK